jgi:hypothetical protein
MIEIDARDISNAGDAESSTRPPPLGCSRGPLRMRPAEHNGMQKYSVLLHSPAQDRQAFETEAQFAAARSERLGFQAFATKLEYKLILLRRVYHIYAHVDVRPYLKEPG